MIRTTFAAATCALLALASTATAAPKPCGTDPRNDVLVADAVRVDAPQVDVLSFDVRRTAKDLTATIRTAGGDGDGHWAMFFRSGDTHYHVVAERSAGGLLADPRIQPGTRFRGDSTHHTEVPVRGRAIRDEVRFTMSLKDLGRDAPRRGVAFTEVEVYSYVNGHVRYTDDVRSVDRCRNL